MKNYSEGQMPELRHIRFAITHFSGQYVHRSEAFEIRGVLAAIEYDITHGADRITIDVERTTPEPAVIPPIARS